MFSKTTIAKLIFEKNLTYCILHGAIIIILVINVLCNAVTFLLRF